MLPACSYSCGCVFVFVSLMANIAAMVGNEHDAQRNTSEPSCMCLSVCVCVCLWEALYSSWCDSATAVGTAR